MNSRRFFHLRVGHAALHNPQPIYHGLDIIERIRWPRLVPAARNLAGFAGLHFDPCICLHLYVNFFDQSHKQFIQTCSRFQIAMTEEKAKVFMRDSTGLVKNVSFIDTIGLNISNMSIGGALGFDRLHIGGFALAA